MLIIPLIIGRYLHATTGLRLFHRGLGWGITGGGAGFAAADEAGQMGVGGVDAQATDNQPSDLRIDADGYYISDTAFGAAGWSPEAPNLSQSRACVIERVVGPFSEFDDSAYQTIMDEGITRHLGNVNELPQVNLEPIAGADGTWGTHDDSYGELVPIFAFDGSNLFDRGREVGLPDDRLDLDFTGTRQITYLWMRRETRDKATRTLISAPTSGRCEWG